MYGFLKGFVLFAFVKRNKRPNRERAIILIQFRTATVHNEPFSVGANTTLFRNPFSEDNFTQFYSPAEEKMRVQYEQQLCHVTLKCEKEDAGLEKRKKNTTHRPRPKERACINRSYDMRSTHLAAARQCAHSFILINKFMLSVLKK